MRFFVTSLCALLLSACATLLQQFDPPYVTLAGLELKEMGLFEQRYLLRLRIQNPNAVPLPIAGMNYSLAINDQQFARGVSNQSLTVAAHGEGLADVEVTSNLGGLLDQLRQLGNQAAPRFDYKLDGSVSLVNSALKLPFSYQGSVGLK
jgi:LEA14-like dessication related protein